MPQVFLTNLRWKYNNLWTLINRCCRAIFNIPTLKIWEVDQLHTWNSHVRCQTCRTAALEIPFKHICYKLHLKLLWKQTLITLFRVNLKKLEFHIWEALVPMLPPIKVKCYHSIPIFL